MMVSVYFQRCIQFCCHSVRELVILTMHVRDWCQMIERLRGLTIFLLQDLVTVAPPRGQHDFDLSDVFSDF